KLKDNNRFGADFYTSLGCKMHCDSIFGLKDVFYKIELKDVSHVDASFSRDLFEVYFKGNKDFAGHTADFSNFNYNLLQYQELKFSLSKDYRNDSSSSVVTAGLSLVNGQHFYRIEAGRATLFTDSGGEFI